MALSDNSTSRENLLFYLDCMQAPDDEADGEISSHVVCKLVSKHLPCRGPKTHLHQEAFHEMRESGQTISSASQRAPLHKWSMYQMFDNLSAHEGEGGREKKNLDCIFGQPVK